MSAFHAGKVLLDRCDTCSAVYFDAGELARHVEVKASVESRLRAAAAKRGLPTDRDCPRCRSGLLRISTPSGRVEVCAGCGGAVVSAAAFAVLAAQGIAVAAPATAVVIGQQGGIGADLAGEVAFEVGATALELLFEGILALFDV